MFALSRGNIAVTVGESTSIGLELPTLRERVDVLLRLYLVQLILGLDLCDQIVFALERGDVLVGELAPLLLNFAPHARA
jgi:hypothetical protein